MKTKNARWIAFNHTPVKIDGAGRILAGGPHRWRGVHVRDVVLVERRARKILHMDCHRGLHAELRRRKIASKFRSLREAVAILRRVNAGWFDAHDAADAADLALSYADGVRKRRPKKSDLLGEHDRTLGGAGRTSWNKVLAAILPRSMNWSDVPSRLEELHSEIQHMSGHQVPPLLVPEGVYEIAEIQRAWDDCEGVKDHVLGELLVRARGGRMRGGGSRRVHDLGDVPF